jgi:hypothetical protein
MYCSNNIEGLKKDVKPKYRKSRGGAVVSKMFDEVKSFTKAVVYGRDDLPPNVRELLEKHGDEVIRSIEIGRTPVNELLTGILSAFSMGH